VTKDEFYELNLGLYRIYWKRGGISLAAIGNNMYGNRWIAPTNWIHISDNSEQIAMLMIWKHIKKVEELETNNRLPTTNN
jgi:hypothetical protein